MNTIDPFSIKSRPKWHPSRLLFTVKARLAERSASRDFDRLGLPLTDPESLPQGPGDVPDYVREDTAVTPVQMDLLLRGLLSTGALHAPVVEIGAYRGVTSAILASQTSRDYFAVDPYMGWGGAEQDYQKMLANTRGLANFRHLRMTSGEAFRSGEVAACSFVFIDAVHDYVNVMFDGKSWGGLLLKGGLLAFHDTDSRIFPGVQRGVAEMVRSEGSNLRIHSHVQGLVILERHR